MKAHLPHPNLDFSALACFPIHVRESTLLENRKQGLNNCIYSKNKKSWFLFNIGILVIPALCKISFLLQCRIINIFLTPSWCCCCILPSSQLAWIQFSVLFSCRCCTLFNALEWYFLQNVYQVSAAILSCFHQLLWGASWSCYVYLGC